MKVIISHVYSSDNKGDAALLSVLIDDIKRQWGEDTDITIFTIDKIKAHEQFEGVPVHNAFMYYALNTHHARILKLIYSLWIIGITNLWAAVRHYTGISLPISRKLLYVCNQYYSSDLIIAVGGGYFRTSPSIVTMMNLLLMLNPLQFAHYLKKPTVLYTQSVGPFYRSIESKLVSHAFKKVPLILIREETSVKLLKKMGVENNVKRSVDSGFLFSAKKPFNLREKFSIPSSQMLIGVTVRKWLSGEAQSDYESAVAKALDELIREHTASVVFIPQVTSVFNGDDDREISKAVYERMSYKQAAHVVTDDLSHYDVKSMYNELDFILGTRFHSVIFSLTSYVPALAIEYEHKTSGIMNDLDLSEWTLKIDEVNSANITQKFNTLIENKEQYIQHLKMRLPQYIEQAKQAIVLTDQAYTSYHKK